MPFILLNADAYRKVFNEILLHISSLAVNRSLIILMRSGREANILHMLYNFNFIEVCSFEYRIIFKSLIYIYRKCICIK